MDKAHEKFEKLKALLSGYGRLAVAFSGGVDSTFLLKAARMVLGEGVLAVTASSPSFPQRELREARAFTEQIGIEHIVLRSDELQIEGFSENPPNRCYICKKELLSKIIGEAGKRGFACVAEASNADDESDYRPGLLAAAELDVKSPLREAGLTKAEIRELSRELGLSTWSKPSFACLATRIPYGETITREKLEMIGKAEQYLIDLGFDQVRVRCHGSLARIETDERGMNALFERVLRDRIYSRFREIGFTYVSMDLQGYRTGSMNETLAL